MAGAGVNTGRLKLLLLIGQGLKRMSMQEFTDLCNFFIATE